IYMRSCTLLISLISAFLCGCCTPNETDRELNGLIRDGWLVSVSDSPVGVYSLTVYGAVNSKLPFLVQEYTGDTRSDCFLVPKGAGYDIVILTKERLSDKARMEIHDMVKKAILEAEVGLRSSSKQ
ncbi:MAG: hypothetical protein NT154_01640, partial [Verrucomicrobia bacterium]|nr:hypothetical protein [Verrucomicrobiota bacterium]